MPSVIQSPNVVADAYKRIREYIYSTPLLSSAILNQMLGSRIYFKIDAFQKTGAFKVRGVLNYLLTLKEQGKLPDKIVAYSTGNHGLGMAYAANLFGIKARLYLPADVAMIKKLAAKYYGAEIIEVSNRQIAEEMAIRDRTKEFLFIPPSDHDSIIAGAGTMGFEAILQMQEKEINNPTAIFASCGGGGLLSGTYLAKKLLAPDSLLIGAEPETAKDAYLSRLQGSVYRFSTSPISVADGLRALSISPRTFNYIQNLDDLYLIEEAEIAYWTSWLIHILKITCEPSAAISMAAAAKWLKNNPDKTKDKTVLVLISGGNLDPSLYRQLAEGNYLSKTPGTEV